MKVKFLPALLLIPAACFTFSACNKEDKVLDPGNNIMTINSLFANLKSLPQTFTVTAGTTQSIRGSKGTILTFHPQSFKNASGNIISGGTVTIELTEMYKPGEMIANRVTTTTMSNQALTSGGCINLKASINGHEVFATSYSLAFRQDGFSDQPMGLFTGTQVTDETGTNIKWNDDMTNPVERTEKVDSTQQYYYLFDSCTSFNWINCDHFYSAPDPKTDIKVVMPDNSYTRNNTQVFVIFPEINSVTTMYSYDNATNTFSFGYPSYYLPVGTTVNILVLGAKNNSYFMAYQQGVVLTNGISVSVSPATQPLSTIQAQLAGM